MADENKGDIGLLQDYINALKDMVALEGHLQRTAAKTGNPAFLEVLKEVRQSRARHMWNIIGQEKLSGEVWCSTKHIALISKQLTEVADKLVDKNDLNGAIRLYTEALDYDAMFHLIIQLGTITSVKRGVSDGDDGQSKETA